MLLINLTIAPSLLQAELLRFVSHHQLIQEVKRGCDIVMDERKNLLWKFADHLTFEKEFGQYLISNSISRESLIDALIWCLGAIASRSKVLFYKENVLD